MCLDIQTIFGKKLQILFIAKFMVFRGKVNLTSYLLWDIYIDCEQTNIDKPRYMRCKKDIDGLRLFSEEEKLRYSVGAEASIFPLWIWFPIDA